MNPLSKIFVNECNFNFPNSTSEIQLYNKFEVLEWSLEDYFQISMKIKKS